MQKVTALIFAVIGIAITAWITGRAPSNTGEFVAYTLPGGLLGYLFGPALSLGLKKIFGGGGTSDGPGP